MFMSTRKHVGRILLLTFLLGVAPVWALTPTEVAKILASDGAADDGFGRFVALSGNTALIGTASNESAYVFTRDSAGVWTEQAKLTTSDGAAGDFFGYAVVLAGDTALIGAWGDDDTRGSAYVFTRDSAGVWTEQAKLTASDRAASDYFGIAVTLAGDTSVIGAFQDDSSRGSAYVFSLVSATGEIAGSPASYDFGNVEWGQTSTAMFTITNGGGGELILSDIAVTEGQDVFSITSAPSLPYTLNAGASTLVEVTFSPETIQSYAGVLRITSSDADEPVIDIPLSGTGVLADTPSEQVVAVIEYIQDAIDAGKLTGVGKGSSADQKVNALINMIEATGDLLEAGQTAEGCQQLADIALKVDGESPPPDFVTGPATTGLAKIIGDLQAHYGCE